jgi:tetratricopeptide (TPR) repeat protein
MLRIAALLIAVVAVLAMLQPRPFLYAYEDVKFMLAPSAERAVAYGNKHFNAIEADEYDINRADTFFRAAAKIDPTYPSVQHQIARIEFLRKNYDAAIEHINSEIATYGANNPNAYYIRALVKGYQGKYLEAAADYETYFKIAPANWAAINDYAWALLRADLPEAALPAIEWGLSEWPDNPWLLHNKIIALYEVGRYEEAAAAADAAVAAVDTVTREGWLMAYPGNDPRVAEEGLASFKQAVQENAAKAKAAAAR